MEDEINDLEKKILHKLPRGSEVWVAKTTTGFRTTYNTPKGRTWQVTAPTVEATLRAIFSA